MKEIIELIKSDLFVIPLGGIIGILAIAGIISDLPMKKIYRIFMGWYYLLTNQKNKVAKRRLSICVDCAHMKIGVCNLCGCVLQAKARIIEEECPANKW
jgi:hypothetical protein